MTKIEFGLQWSSAAVGTVVIYGATGGLNPTSTNGTLKIIDKTINKIPHYLKISACSCFQVQGSVGTWKPVDAYVCHSNTWVQFSFAKQYLIQNGIAKTSFVAKGVYLNAKWKDSYTRTAPTIANNSSGYYKMSIGASGQSLSGLVITSSKVPINGYSKIYITGKSDASSDFPQQCGFFARQTPTYGSEEMISRVSLPINGQAEATKSFNISAAGDTSIYIGFRIYCYGKQYNTYIKNLWLE